MKKALIGLWFCGLMLLVSCIAILSNETRYIATCDQDTNESFISTFDTADSKGPYAKRFPVL